MKMKGLRASFSRSQSARAPAERAARCARPFFVLLPGMFCAVIAQFAARHAGNLVSASGPSAAIPLDGVAFLVSEINSRSPPWWPLPLLLPPDSRRPSPNIRRMVMGFRCSAKLIEKPRFFVACSWYVFWMGWTVKRSRASIAERNHPNIRTLSRFFDASTLECSDVRLGW